MATRYKGTNSKGESCAHGYPLIRARRYSFGQGCPDCWKAKQGEYAEQPRGSHLVEQAKDQNYTAIMQGEICPHGKVVNLKGAGPTGTYSACKQCDKRFIPQRAANTNVYRAGPAAVAWRDDAAILKFYEQAQANSDLAGIDYEVDHVIPLHGTDADGNPSVSGLHVEINLQVLTVEENRAKGSRFDP